MKKITLLFTVSILGCFLLSFASAGNRTFLFSKQYDRTKGKPDVYSNTFNAVPGKALLLVENGLGNDSGSRISSAEIRLNGILLFGPADFNKNITHHETTVILSESNTLQVILKGKPGSFLTIKLESTRAPPPSVSLSVAPDTIPSGGSSTLTWASTDAATVTIDNDIGTIGLSRTQSVSPTVTTTYTITAVGTGGTVTESVTLTVLQPPTISLSADPLSITSGDSTQLSWTSTNADSVTITPDIGIISTNGSQDTSPVETTTYTITAIGPGGTASDTVTVEVLPSGPAVTITAEPETMPLGTTSLLSWQAGGVDTIHIDNGIGAVAASDSLSVA
ncbi:MAG: hypothetical protein D3922_05780, partial [Candidatus Electrothrix sp. AR1]|nr:hypothetical protein [Candidatus Electrothrix sp. AR1]